MTLTILVDIYFHRDHPRARDFIYKLFDQPVDNSHAIKLIIARHRDSLTAGDDDNPNDQGNQLRARTLAFYEAALDIAWQGQAEIRATYEGRSRDAWPAEASAALKEYFGILHDITMQLYFASGASAHRQGNVDFQAPNAVQMRFYRETSPLLHRLTDAPAGAIAHYLIDTLEFFADLEPAPIFHLIVN
jgi:hypothetical protein